ncbi:hypothetical protein N493_19180 (plasmid) [Clostridium botulinum B2 433]|uniref:hypothetical protein n=1 Tax=Clostridium botulinum TaxID=1491 RepID=UPI0007E1D581|nr:hypothetical protein [Clostridium botulinum]KEI84029.1 hypothetical protein N493_19180 [Clostridium botulinum B2 433]
MKIEASVLIILLTVAFVRQCIWSNTPKVNKFKDLKYGLVRFKLNHKLMISILCDKRGGIFKPMEYSILLKDNSLIWIDAKNLLVKQY